MSKPCKECRLIKDLSLFYKNRGTKDGLQSVCKICSDHRYKVYAAKNRAKITLKSKLRRHQRCRENPQLDQMYKLKAKYGISVDKHKAMVEEQNGRCAVCTNPPSKRGLFVDHCHVSNKVRALLCQHCNSLLGAAKDNPETLRNAASYVERFRENK